ncbi:MAG: flagellar assembly protein FliW [Phycisphaerae bacterium]|nr:flagellar assembly protein FliW [Phycisphaerae bacterium]
MRVNTTRFGEIEIDQQRIMNFPKGVLGFPDNSLYALLQTNNDGSFFWLQSIERPELAFVVCDPVLFIPDYQVPVKGDELQQIDLDSLKNAQILIIVNKVGKSLTGNLQGPLVINVNNRQGKQLVLSEKKYSTRHPLMELPASSEKQVCQTA